MKEKESFSKRPKNNQNTGWEEHKTKNSHAVIPLVPEV